MASSGNQHCASYIGTFSIPMRWVTVRKYTASVYNQPFKPIRPPTLTERGNNCRPRDSALRPGI